VCFVALFQLHTLQTYSIIDGDTLITGWKDMVLPYLHFTSERVPGETEKKRIFQ
jgi:hypothetical protein